MGPEQRPCSETRMVVSGGGWSGVEEEKERSRRSREDKVEAEEKRKRRWLKPKMIPCPSIFVFVKEEKLRR